MPIVMPNQGEEIALDLLLAINMTMRLFSNDVTSGLTDVQIEALTESSFTDATFTGYAAKSLTGGSWVSTQADPSTGTYAQQTYTRTSTGTAQTLYGYSMHRASDNKLLWFEYFTGPITVATNGDTIQITPTITLDDDEEATVAARGLLTSQTLTANSTGYTASGNSDMVLNSVTVDATRNYRIGLHAWWNTNAAAFWIPLVTVDAVQYSRMGCVNVAASSFNLIDSSVLWQPDTGTYTLRITLAELTGTATLTFEGSSTVLRQFWVEDIGPR